jgi:hypothetical protein
MRIIRAGHCFVKMVMVEESCFAKDNRKKFSMLQNRPSTLGNFVLSSNTRPRKQRLKLPKSHCLPEVHWRRMMTSSNQNRIARTIHTKRFLQPTDECAVKQVC